MPLYEYDCLCCGSFAYFRTVNDRNVPVACPTCQGEAERAIRAPNLALMHRSVRQAHAINEKSSHAPTLQNRHSCAQSCGCGKSASVAADRRPTKEPKLQSGRKNQRPWMLGH